MIMRWERRRLATSARARYFFVMPHINCTRCGQTRDQMSFQPFQNELGRRLYQEICATCWAEWIKAQQQMINHYGLNVRDPKAKEMLLKSMEQFLFAGGQIQLS
ncbi:MAG: hypothetical protein H6Q77_109 [Gemmatimonadetes bacterium]|jgi:Fe-S cluster biosynthesis and repair protein YggX|nr:hypothetical protein [Gemmatimonadota bacterium]